MYNTDLPRRADLPTSAQLWRSTIIAVISACAILITVVLPAEYAVDPTGVGRLLGLTEMGEIKTQLAAEAEADRQATANPAPGPAATEVRSSAPSNEELARRLDEIEELISSDEYFATSGFEKVEGPTAAPAEPPAAAPSPPTEIAAAAIEEPPVAAPEASTIIAEGNAHEVSFTLAPGQGAEIKLVMNEGAKANFAWTANGAVVNYDTHGDGGGQKVSYEQGRGVASDQGVLEAAFDGNHGWFWRNRTDADVTVTLRTSGDYIELKRMI